MIKKYYISILVLTCLSFWGNSQIATFNMKDTTVTDCNGIHKDSDAQFGGRYGKNEDFTFSICPGNGAQIVYSFNFLSLEAEFDSIWFLDGPNAGSPFIVGYTGNFGGTPPPVVANSGCLTIRFISDGTVDLNGWDATWNTNAPAPYEPIMTTSVVSPPTCGSDFFTLDFDVKVPCDSILTTRFAITGTNAPAIKSVTPVNCINDSATGVLIDFFTDFNYNCEYILDFDLNILDVCDSLYRYQISDTFSFNACDLQATVSADQAICIGQCANVSASVLPGCNTYDYSWTGGLPSTAGPHSVCPLTTTKYYITITEQETGLTYFDSVEIIVTDTLDTDIDIEISSGVAPACNGTNFNVIFTKPIQCAYLDSGTFVLRSANAPPVVTTVTPLNCTGNEIDSVEIVLGSPLVSNCDYFLDYVLNFSDPCNGAVNITVSDTFSLTTCALDLALTYEDTVCLGNCEDVTALITGCSTYTYVWSNGLPPTAGPHNVCPTTDTVFWVDITEDSTGLTVSDTVRMRTFPTGITLDMTLDPVIPNCAADSIVVNFSPSVNCGAIQIGNFNLNGGIQVPGISAVAAINCVGNEATSAVIRLTNPFEYNCDYEVTFQMDSVDPCGVNNTLVLTDSFRVVDCEINYTIDFPDTVCGGDCGNVLITPVSTCFGLHYVWSNGLPDSPGPHNICPTQDTMFTVIITEDSTGVVAYDTVRITADNSLLNYTMTIDSAVGLPSCDSVNIHVKFSNKLLCDSIYAGLFNFTSANATPAIVSVIPTGCSGPLDSTNTATITLANTYPGNCSYTLSYDVNSSFCNSTLSTAFDILDCELTAVVSFDDTVCYNSSTDVNVTTNSCFPIAYTWSNGLPGFAGPHNIAPNGDTIFTVTLNEAFTGNTLTDTIDIKYINSMITPNPTACIYDPSFNLTSGRAGGIWTGPGILNSATGLFDPAIAGVGTHEIKYVVLGCRDSIDILVTNPEAGPFDTLCESGTPYNLTGFSPAGGSWSGPNVTPTGVFTPASFGTYRIFYTVNGCTDSTEIYVDTIVKSYSRDSVCRYNTPFNIPISPSGGTWSGPGITNAASGTFDPAVANSGLNTLYYDYIACRDSVEIFVVDVAAGRDTIACPEQPQFNLDPGTPSGGIWAGMGIINPNTALYDPSLVPNNTTDTVTYGIYGCFDTVLIDIIQTDIVVDTLPFCINDIPIQLIGTATNPITPPGGDWTGNGVTTIGSDYYFDPSLAGAGAHVLTYEQNTCSDSIVMTVYPESLSYLDSTVCNTHLPFQLESAANVPGASWVGPGITNSNDGTFDPSVANIGVNVIQYVNPAFNCSDSIRITVYPFVPSTITFADTLCYFNQDSLISAVPPAGTWSGSGIYNQTAGSINPSTAGITSHEIIYTFGVGQCLTADTHTVVIRDSLSLTLNALPDNVCPGSLVTLSANGINGNTTAGYTYTWGHTLNTGNVQTLVPPFTQTYTVTVNDGCSTPSTRSVLVTVHPEPVSTISTSPTVCFGSNGWVTYDQTQPNHSYTWLNPAVATDSVFSPAESTVSVRITNNFGCTKDTSVTIPSFGQILADFDLTPDLPFKACLPFSDPTINLEDLSSGALTGTWNLGETSFAYSPGVDINYTYQTGGIYEIKLTVKNAGPCFDSITDTVCVIEEPVFVPDVFSPNNDGANDMLFVRGQQIDKIELHVFDRWGTKMFESRDMSLGWDGTYNIREANAGVYVYYVKALLKSGEVFELKGDVTLVR